MVPTEVVSILLGELLCGALPEVVVAKGERKERASRSTLQQELPLAEARLGGTDPAVEPEAPVKALMADTQGAWADITPLGPGSALPEDPNARAAAASFDAFLRDFLLTENVVVLAGLGASMCVQRPDGSNLCPTMAELWDEAKADAGAAFDKIIEAVHFDPSNGNNIEQLLSQCQVSQAFAPDDAVQAFIEKVESVIVRRCRFPLGDESLDTHETFLRRMARGTPRKPRMRLFTTNYDLCFERAASRAQFIAIDGFSHTLPQVFDGNLFSYDLVRRERDGEAPDYIPNVFHLSKLHGSVDWVRDGGQVKRSESPARPLIVYPRRSKFESSFEQPFLELMSRFQAALRQPNTALLVVGFGFNDDHIAQPIEAAVRANVGLRVVVVAPDLEVSQHPAISFFKNLIERADRRLLLCASTFERFVPLLPDLIAQSEEERHRERLRDLGR